MATNANLIAPRPEAGRLYAHLTRRRQAVLAGLAGLLLLSLLLDIALGPASLALGEVVSALLARSTTTPSVGVIVWEIRLPMALTAVLVGAALATAGAEMQTILNNPLASPFTLGVSAAASFGAALAFVTGIGVLPVAGIFLVTTNAFVFALLASVTIYLVSRLRGASVETMVLLGIAQVFLYNALLALLEYLANEQTLQQIVFWTLGSLAKATWPKVGLLALALVVTLPPLLRQVWRLTALRLGEEQARGLGVDVERLRLRVLLLVSLLAAIAVAFVGTIGFVGLVGPHVARMLVGEDQRYFLPASALAGALLLSATSIVSKTIVPGVLVPIGIITALIGVPFFVVLILSQRRALW